MERPDFAAVSAFAKVAETGNFRAAAISLSSPVSTVSVQVRRLEERLGTKLVERTTRRVTLTEEGRSYFEQVRVALDAMAEAERSVSGRALAARGRLRVGSPLELGQAVFGQVLGPFVEEHPEVELEIELRNDRIDPVRDGFDVVLQTDPPDSSSLVAKKLGAPTKYLLVASPDYLRRRGVPRHPRDLALHTCLVMGTRQAPTTWRFVRGSTRQTLVHRHVSANTWSIVRDLAVAGSGIARLPSYMGAPAVAEGTLVTVLEAFAPPPEQLYAVYVRSPHVPLRIQSFVAALKAFLDVWPGCLAKPGRRPK
jgi:DNA-binding transcriptional LysR family regulator